MGKIRHLREDEIIGGASHEHIYPITSVHAVFDGNKSLALILLSIDLNKLFGNSVDTLNIINGAITTLKIASGSVTGEKILDNTITADKLSLEVLELISAATGVPQELLEKIDFTVKTVDELAKTYWPITIDMSINSNLVNMLNVVKFNVAMHDLPFIGESLLITKLVNSGDKVTLIDTPSASGMITSAIEGNKETFEITVTASEDLVKDITKTASITNYLCYVGSTSSETLHSSDVDTFAPYYVLKLCMNVNVATADNLYIWILVPQELAIKEVYTSGIMVICEEPVIITTAKGEFYAYRTTNALLENVWKLNIV